jgi:hypothetical protein
MVVVDDVSRLDALSSNRYDFLNIIQNHTLVASFKPIGAVSWTIEASTDGGNGRIIPGGDVRVVQGGQQTFTLSASSGCHVDDVTLDGVSIGAPTSFSITFVDGNHSVVARFKESICDISGYVAGSPKNGVSVRLIQNDAVCASVLTDEAGFYQFNDAPWGCYQVSFKKSGCWISPSNISINCAADEYVLQTVTASALGRSKLVQCSSSARSIQQIQVAAICFSLIPLLRRVRLSKRIE